MLLLEQENKFTPFKDENQWHEFYKEMFELCNRVMFFKMAEQDPSRLATKGSHLVCIFDFFQQHATFRLLFS